MSTHLTIRLDSGFILSGGSEARVGYFQSEPAETELRAYADGDEIKIGDTRLGSGAIDITHLASSGPVVGGVELTAEFIDSVLTLDDLYPEGPPLVNDHAFDSWLDFKSGRFSPSMVKWRRFVEWEVGSGTMTGKALFTPRPIAHDVEVYYYLSDGDVLQITRRVNGAILFTTKDLPPGITRLDVEIIADNSTATKFYRTALGLGSRQMYWLPNSGDSPPCYAAVGLGGRHRTPAIVRKCKYPGCGFPGKYASIDRANPPVCKNPKLPPHNVVL